MDTVSYFETKELIYESYQNFIEEGYSFEEAIAATLEDCILMMKKSKVIYCSVIYTLVIISLENKCLPDYLEERMNQIFIEGFGTVPSTEEDGIKQDKQNIEKELVKEDYVIEKTGNYKARIDMLLN